MKKLIKVDSETGEQITLVSGNHKEVYEAFLTICINVIIEHYCVKKEYDKIFVYYYSEGKDLLHHYYEIIGK